MRNRLECDCGTIRVIVLILYQKQVADVPTVRLFRMTFHFREKSSASFLAWNRAWNYRKLLSWILLNCDFTSFIYFAVKIYRPHRLDILFPFYKNVIHIRLCYGFVQERIILECSDLIILRPTCKSIS